MLAPLGDYSGPTQTHALLPGSPAINASFTALGVEDPTTDQRGVDRLVGPAGDIGAYESEPPAEMRVDNLGDGVNGYYGDGDLTLREAVIWAGLTDGQDTVGFAKELVEFLEAQPVGAPQMITLDGSSIVLDGEISIAGPDPDVVTISANGLSRVFSVNPNAKVKISGVAITGGNPGGDGGGINNQGDLELRNVVIHDNDSGSGPGGGIYSSGAPDLGWGPRRGQPRKWRRWRLLQRPNFDVQQHCLRECQPG